MPRDPPPRIVVASIENGSAHSGSRCSRQSRRSPKTPVISAVAALFMFASQVRQECGGSHSALNVSTRALLPLVTGSIRASGTRFHASAKRSPLTVAFKRDHQENPSGINLAEYENNANNTLGREPSAFYLFNTHGPIITPVSIIKTDGHF